VGVDPDFDHPRSPETRHRTNGFSSVVDKSVRSIFGRVRHRRHFVPGSATRHGFDPRRIVGVRRFMEIDYVRQSWRDRAQLASPDRPITLA
jgi:hypothetical protein